MYAPANEITAIKLNSLPEVILLHGIFKNLTPFELVSLARVDKVLHNLLVNKYDLYFRSGIPLRLERVQNDFATWMQFGKELLAAAHERKGQNFASVFVPLLCFFMIELGFLLPHISGQVGFEIDLQLIIAFSLLIFFFRVLTNINCFHRQTLGNYLTTTGNLGHKNAIEKMISTRKGSFTTAFWCSAVTEQKLLDFIINLHDFLGSEIKELSADIIQAMKSFAIVKDGTVCRYLEAVLQVFQAMRKTLQQDKQVDYDSCSLLLYDLDDSIAGLQHAFAECNKNYPEQKLSSTQSLPTLSFVRI